MNSFFFLQMLAKMMANTLW